MTANDRSCDDVSATWVLVKDWPTICKTTIRQPFQLHRTPQRGVSITQEVMLRAFGIGLSDVGKHRSVNEDHLLVDDELGLYVVSDGIGGEVAGEVASHLAVSMVAKYLSERRSMINAIRTQYGDESRLAQFATGAVTAASRVVYEAAKKNPALAGMGCTLTVLLMGNNSAAMAHVGDSRIYLERNGNCHQISADHNVAQELIAMGAIKPAQAGSVWGGRTLTRAIGREEWTRVDQMTIELQDGDRFVLCSDGLSDYLFTPELLGELLYGYEFEDYAQRLVDYANGSGGHDNITALIVEIHNQTLTMQPRMEAFIECTTPH